MSHERDRLRCRLVQRDDTIRALRTEQSATEKTLAKLTKLLAEQKAKTSVVGRAAAAEWSDEWPQDVGRYWVYGYSHDNVEIGVIDEVGDLIVLTLEGRISRNSSGGQGVRYLYLFKDSEEQVPAAPDEKLRAILDEINSGTYRKSGE